MRVNLDCGQTTRGRSFGQFSGVSSASLGDFERHVRLVFKEDEGEPVGLIVWLI